MKSTEPRGARARRRILEAVAVMPKTTKQLAEELNMHASTVLLHVRPMREEGLLHIAGHEPTHRNKPACKYGPGDCPDVVYQRPHPTLVSRGEMRIARMVELLKAGPRTGEQLSLEMKLSRSPTRSYLRQMRAEGKVYIKGWALPRGRGDLLPIYALGKHEDAPKPPQQTRADHYRKEKADPEKYGQILARQRVRHRVEQCKKKPHGIFAALGL